MKLQRIPYSGSTDSRIVHNGEDIARISGPHDKTSCIAYPDKVAKEIVRAVNGRKALLDQLDEANEELARLRAKPSQLKTVNLDAISRSSGVVSTRVRFEDYDLMQVLTEERQSPGGGRYKQALNWLEFGEADLRNEKPFVLSGRIRSGITDREHDTPYVVHIALLGLTHRSTYNHVTYFEAYLSPDPDQIRIYPPDFVPEEVAEPCQGKDCKPHLTIEKYTPPVYELAHVVAGKQVVISIGPRWSALKPKEEEE